MAQQAAAAADALSELKAMIVLVGPHDWGAFTFGTGAMNPDMVSWVGAMAAMERKETWLPPPFHMSWHRERMARDLSAVSLMDGMRRYIGGELPEWFDGIVTGNVEFPVATDALERIEGTAVLVVAGWADTFIEQCLVQYRRLKERGQVVGLTVGPWGHLSAQGGESKREILQWLDQYLAPKTAVKAKQESRKALVRIFDTGTKQWLETDAWPLENTRTTQWFLSAEGRLEASPPGAAPAETSFEYDPRNPTPNIGSSMLNYQAGKLADDRSLAARSDVIAFTTEPLEQDIRVMGSPVLSLAHSSSHPFADLSVRVCAVEANGTSHNISEAYQRLDKLDRGPETGELLQLTLVECAHTFRKGTRIRVVIAGGSHPKYVRNLGTGEDMVHGVNMESVKHTVHHGGERASSLTLPVDV
ncbi:galactose-binding domain-like protein [Microdochium trichocladiopsis]|uniref:Galactose-binding domain-like protein n=1 Tax=Microdochium trichocladiopsis TaxID=1682393 RepID=A0A9P9BIB1_9PEZI|nr:galactose-binding domain-like protein [Microdochium trichocladiopsis]KAH7014223.1 galactose-binding domain-like protein [Microdochium trichocladiopsis]